MRKGKPVPDGGDALVLTTVPTIGEIASAEWDACAGVDNPFVSHGFLNALEDSGSVGRKTGWQPLYPTIRNGGGVLLAVAPMYVKSHSYGEYVFDHGWAQAYERAGGQYYPKLQISVPFTPVPGPRLLVRPGADAVSVRSTLARGMIEVARRLNLSSLHITFPNEYDRSCLEQQGLMLRLGCQYHWSNRGYRCFDDFLNDLSSRKRKMIRRERREAVADGIAIRALSGADILPRHWDAFFGFYQDTGGRKWGRPYLTRAFFDCIGATMAQNVVLMLAEKDGRPVAGALNLRGGDALFGRNWGCLVDYKFLHFETCYYQAIDYAIRHGIQRVEAGAQGEHKIQRGYLPVATWSAHWIRDPNFAAAVEEYLGRERREIEAEMRALEAYSPFRSNLAESSGCSHG